MFSAKNCIILKEYRRPHAKYKSMNGEINLLIIKYQSTIDGLVYCFDCANEAPQTGVFIND